MCPVLPGLPGSRQLFCLHLPFGLLQEPSCHYWSPSSALWCWFPYESQACRCRSTLPNLRCLKTLNDRHPASSPTSFVLSAQQHGFKCKHRHEISIYELCPTLGICKEKEASISLYGRIKMKEHLRWIQKWMLHPERLETVLVLVPHLLSKTLVKVSSLPTEATCPTSS